MSGKTLVIVGVVVVALVVVGVVIFARTEPQQAMADGPGVLYFYSPT